MAAALGALLLACSDAQGPEPAPIGGEAEPSDEQAVDGDGDEGAEEPNEPDEPQEPLHTTVPEDVEDLDEEYAQAVLDHLMGIYNDGMHRAMQGAPVPEGAPPAALYAAVHATIEPSWVEGILEHDLESLTEPAWSERADRRLPPDQWEGQWPHVQSVEVHDDGRCLLVEAEFDQSGVLHDPPESPIATGHVLARSQEHPSELNESSWVMVPPIPLEGDGWGAERCP